MDSKLRCSLNLSAFKDLVSSHLYHPKLKKDLVNGIKDLTLLLKDIWNENDELIDCISLKIMARPFS